MISIHSLISSDCILINPPVNTKNELLRALVDILAEGGKVEDPDHLFEDVLEREKLASTAMGVGCAVPHVHSSGVEKTEIGVALIKEGIDFEAPDGQSVSLVIMIVGPAEKARLHLKLLSKIARFLHDSEFRRQLMDANNPEEFLSLLKSKEG